MQSCVCVPVLARTVYRGGGDCQETHTLHEVHHGFKSNCNNVDPVSCFTNETPGVLGYFKAMLQNGGEVCVP